MPLAAPPGIAGIAALAIAPLTPLTALLFSTLHAKAFATAAESLRVEPTVAHVHELSDIERAAFRRSTLNAALYCSVGLCTTAPIAPNYIEVPPRT